MPGNDWLASRRSEVAVDRILDAAEELYTQRDQASIGMNEIAMQHVVMAAHQPQGDPIADRKHNDANNTSFKHLGLAPESPNDSTPSEAGQALKTCGPVR